MQKWKFKNLIFGFLYGQKKKNLKIDQRKKNRKQIIFAISKIFNKSEEQKAKKIHLVLPSILPQIRLFYLVGERRNSAI